MKRNNTRSVNFALTALATAMIPITNAQAAEGIEVDGNHAVIYFDNQGWRGNWNFMCLASNCTPGALNTETNRWERDISNQGIQVGGQYIIELKIDDAATGQFLSGQVPVIAEEVGDPTPIPTPTPTPIPTPTPTPIPTPTPDPTPVDAINVSDDAILGEYLTGGESAPEVNGRDKTGFTLYTFVPDNAGPSTCFGGCADVWPPYLVDSADALGNDEGVTLGVVARQGTDQLQVTLKNEPLYYYTPDVSPGDTLGHGASNGNWLVADLGPEPIPTPTPTPNPTPAPTPIPVSNGDFCLEATGPNSGLIRHLDKPFTANFANLCLNGQCAPAQLVNGYWQRAVDGLNVGTDYQIGTQIQDNELGQCLENATVTFSQAGECVTSACTPADIDPPSVPTGLSLSSKNGDVITAQWTASTDDRGVAQYVVYRDGVEVGTVASTLFNDSGLSAATTYVYTVKACDAADNCSAQSNPEQITTGEIVVDTTPPTVPEGIVQTAVSPLSMSIAWNASTDALGVVTQYDIYRDGVKVGETAGETHFDDAGLESSTDYRYQVLACDDSNNCSDLSPAVVLTSGSPRFDHLDWTSNSYTQGKVGPEPRVNPPEALATPILGVAPSTFGFAFDIDGNQLRWRWGPNIVKQAGDSGLEMNCSEDNNATFKTVVVTGGTATIPCRGEYTYFFRYLHPHSLNDDPAHQWIWTGLFTTQGDRVDPNNYPAFVDSSANWMRIRHPVTTDGITAAVLDRPNGGELLRNLDRYLIWVNDTPGNLDFEMDLNFMDKSEVSADVTPGFRRNEALRSAAGGPNGQQFFAVNTAAKYGDDYRNAPQEGVEGFGEIDGNPFSYGQVISFEFSAEAAGRTSAQTYNDFSHYVVGCGFCGKYGDPRLNSAGKASTAQVFSDAGQFINLERNAIFTQPLVTIHKQDMIDDFLVGHHLFHGIAVNTQQGDAARTMFDNPDMRIGERSCGGCHFRDGRGTEVIQTAKGPRLPPPVYGVKLLEWMEGRESGFSWDGSAPTVQQQVVNALRDDHGVKASDLPGRVFDVIVAYVEALTVPSRHPGSYDDPQVVQGDVLFNQVGCADCHTPVAKTRSDAPSHLRDIVIRPYTDMKNHDMGEGSFRTAPLWGIGQNKRLLGWEHNGSKSILYMHDGASPTVDHAVQRHKGSAAASTAQYNALSASEKAAIEAFIETL